MTITQLQDTELRALVLQAQAGDRAAFGELAERFERAVYATAMRRLGNDAEAQELTQEVFVQAMRKLHQLREPACFASWLRSMTNRMAINRAVRRGPMLSTDASTLEATVAEDSTPMTDVLRREEAQQVRHGLRRLGKLDRETLEAFYLSGQSLAEMSESFASPVGTIKRRLHVARKRLAKELHELAPT
ncbi:MAG: sigma-70 family RNA polymerase sigma factor [Pirellulales bacterium]|nr:sigma-70 family RNA polymerase sigma factor [Pirellulales bacterium]